ncbi:MAG TPA: glycosyltransferase family 39 protein [Thermoleophilaceae bacterium]
MTSRDIRRALLGLVVLAAALRFWRIGHQSYWLDEVFTVNLVNEDLAGMLKGVRETESTPHLYYALAWLWEKVTGDGEGALRSLSALFGIATVPVAYLAGRELFRPAVALTAAALVAVNPWLVWYSQEARAYALLVLLTGAALLFFLRGRVWPWALCSALAVLTHYFAAFMVAPMGLWLVWTRRDRASVAASAAVAAVGVALAPLALDQRASGHTEFIESISLGDRVTDLPKKFVTGELGTPTPGLGPLAGVLVAAALLLLWRAPAQDRRRALGLAALVGVTLAVPLALALAGFDYLFPRNAIAALVPAAVTLAAGFATSRAGLIAAAALCATAIAVNVQVGLNESLQRDDWRALARAMGPATADRGVVLNGQVQLAPLEHYVPGLRRYPAGGARLGEIVAIHVTRSPGAREPQPPPGFALAGRTRAESFELVRFRSRSPAGVGPPFLEGARLDDGVPALRLQPRR